MKVRELIDILLKIDPEKNVYIDDDGHGASEIFDIYEGDFYLGIDDSLVTDGILLS